MLSALYRYDGHGTFISLTEYKVLSETPCGYWVREKWGYESDPKKWVSKNGKNRHCYPTKREALHNLICRRERYIRILTARINRSKDIIYECKILKKKKEK